MECWGILCFFLSPPQPPPLPSANNNSLLKKLCFVENDILFVIKFWIILNLFAFNSYSLYSFVPYKPFFIFKYENFIRKIDSDSLAKCEFIYDCKIYLIYHNFNTAQLVLHERNEKWEGTHRENWEEKSIISWSHLLIKM